MLPENLSWSARFAQVQSGQMDREKICNAMKTLTPREREVLNGVVSGLLNKEIASELGITERTVKAHRGSVMAKMGAKSSAELIKIVVPAAWWQAPSAPDEWKDTSKYRPHESSLKRSRARASAVRYLRRSDTNESGS